MREVTTGIYQITIANKRYIGSAVNAERRWYRHKSELHNNKHPNQKLQRAYNKYGSEQTVFEIVEVVEDIECLIPREQHWIDTQRPELNIRPVAESNLGWVPSEETLSRRSDGMKLAWQDPDKRKNMMRAVEAGAAAVRDKPLSEEHRKKVSERTKEALARPEVREKLRQAMRKPKSDVAKAASSVAAKKRWESEEYRQKFTEARKEKRDYKRPEEVRARISEGKMGKERPDLATRNADPEYQAKVKAGRDAYWAKKRAERQQQSETAE